MRNAKALPVHGIALTAGISICIFALSSALAQTTEGATDPGARAQVPAAPGVRALAEPLFKLEDALLQWPLSAADKAYGAIDGRRLHQVVGDLTAISRRYRDEGHPQFWGRIIGTSADAESQQYLLDRFKRIGLTDVRLQSFCPVNNSTDPYQSGFRSQNPGG